MNHASNAPAYGLWTLVIINAAIFILFAFSFFKPRTKRDWRTFSSFSAFIVALFIEMYGFPLTIYLLSGWLAARFPGVDLLGHDAGHLWYALLGLKGDPHWNPIHLASNIVIGGGFVLLASAWRVLYVAQTQQRLATTGPYRWIRHPQYAGFILVMLGFLLQWPTLVTLAMFPVLLVMYARLAHREEREVEAAFGEQWRAYAALTPRWIPGRRNRSAAGTGGAAARA
jgi:protein-S-isoprenylcysteine O-methyltransferase Ste14